MKDPADGFVAILRRVPLFGPALDCGAGEHWQTATEIFPGLFWSMLPIWVGTFVSFADGNIYNWGALHSAFSGSITGGELFIYAAAFLAPILWIVHHVPPGAGRFPSPLAHGLLTVIITVFAALSLEMQKSAQPPNPAILHRLALIFFWASVVLIYLGTLYHNHRLPIFSQERLTSQTRDFVSTFGKRHR